MLTDNIVGLFMKGYFNDTVGAITFIAYTNVVTNFKNIRLVKLWQIELILFSCGVFWEYVTPLFRKDTVSDIWDIVTYLMGGVIYWLISKIYKYIRNYF